MSETGGEGQERTAAPRVEDIERALVLAREVAAATAKGGAANLRVEHLRALFPGGNGRVAAERMQAALEAAGLSVDPPLADGPDTVSLRVGHGRATLAREASTPARGKPDRPEPAAADDEPPPRPAGVAAYQAAAGTGRRRAAAPPPIAAPSGVTLADAQRKAAADQAELRTPQSIGALMPALVVPVLAASFLGPLFGVIFGVLTLLTSAMLSRPGALADGKLGPLRMPASLARSFLLVSSGVAIGALGMSIALMAAGTSSTKSESTPLEKSRQTAPATTKPPAATTPAPATPAQSQSSAATAQQKARADRRKARDRRARARARRAQQQQASPPSGGATTTTP